MATKDSNSRSPGATVQTTPTPGVVYAGKSTLDPNGSIQTQLQDGHALAEREGVAIVAEFSDENASAFKGNRGPNFARALAECERLISERGACSLIVQHSDRIARGDGREAKHLVEYALWAKKTGVAIRSVQDPQTFGDLLYAVVTGQRNNEDSARKAKAVKDGLLRLAQRGGSGGALALTATGDGRG